MVTPLHRVDLLFLEFGRRKENIPRPNPSNSIFWIQDETLRNHVALVPAAMIDVLEVFVEVPSQAPHFNLGEVSQRCERSIDVSIQGSIAQGDLNLVTIVSHDAANSSCN